MVTDSSKSSFSTKPALGPTWAHVPNTRLFIQKQMDSSASERIATVVKSSRQVLPLEDFHNEFARLTDLHRTYITKGPTLKTGGSSETKVIFGIPKRGWYHKKSLMLSSVQLSMNI